MECYLMLAIVAAIVLVALKLFWSLDCDVTLTICSKYGRSLGSFKGQVVWITGPASGIGQQIAFHLAKNGAKLALSDLNMEGLEKTKAKCIELGANPEHILCLSLDLAQYETHQEVFDKIINEFGRVDVLINNAGRAQRCDFQDITMKVEEELFAIDVFGNVSLSKLFVRYLLKENRPGRIAVTSSCAGKLGVPNSATYTGAKHALHGYYECLRTEMARKGLSITMVCPGPTFSNVIENSMTGQTGERFGVKQSPTDWRMKTERCAELYLFGVANGLDEIWIGLQPYLSFFYAAQYLPSVFRYVFSQFYTPERAFKMREGRFW